MVIGEWRLVDGGEAYDFDGRGRSGGAERRGQGSNHGGWKEKPKGRRGRVFLSRRKMAGEAEAFCGQERARERGVRARLRGTGELCGNCHNSR